MSNIVNYVQESVSKIAQFNEIAGVFGLVNKASIALQLDLEQEEYLEQVKAFDENDDAEFLKESIDLFVVAVGNLIKLEAAGFNVAEAMVRVDNNNLSKFPPPDNITTILPKGYTQTYNEVYNVFVLKDENGKIRKPASYKKVDVSDCAVAGFLKESA